MEKCTVSVIPIRVFLGLKDTPRYIPNVRVPTGTRLQTGRIGPQPKFGLNNNSGFQYQLLEEIPDSAFLYTRRLP